ncbi:Hyp2 [Leptospira interrogans serovar Canicola]|nr:Hyp2 [Leptospira interrogans serovar Canicola]
MKLSLNTQKKCAEGFVTRTRLLVLIGKFLIRSENKKKII